MAVTWMRPEPVTTAGAWRAMRSLSSAWPSPPKVDVEFVRGSVCVKEAAAWHRHGQPLRFAPLMEISLPPLSFNAASDGTLIGLLVVKLPLPVGWDAVFAASVDLVPMRAWPGWAC